MENVSYYKSFLSKDLKKLYTIMRNTIIVLFTVVLQAVAVESSYSQSATLSVKAEHIFLTDLFSQIEKQSEFLFFYVDEDVKNIEVNVRANDKPINEVLTRALKGTNLTYIIDDRNINIIKKNNIQQAQQAKKRITGVVVDPSGIPVIGANVVEEGTSNGTITDIDGKFSLELSENATIQISYIGYNSQFIAIKGKTSFNIQLEEDTKALDEVVVVGYGVQKRMSVTGSLATASGSDLAKVPTPNVTNTLAGRMPGLVSYNRSGEPGYDDAKLLIRGASTTGDATPLVVVDGVADRAGGFNRIDPNDIESITILKDASAAIYGSRAANGVVLVTTKRGKEEKVTINYNGNVGMSMPTILPEMASSAEYAQLLNEINPDTYTPEQIQKFRNGSDPVNYPNIDAFDLLTRQALQTQHNVSVSGGSKIVNFYASLGYQY